MYLLFKSIDQNPLHALRDLLPQLLLDQATFDEDCINTFCLLSTTGTLLRAIYTSRKL